MSRGHPGRGAGKQVLRHDGGWLAAADAAVNSRSNISLQAAT